MKNFLHEQEFPKYVIQLFAKPRRSTDGLVGFDIIKVFFMVLVRLRDWIGRRAEITTREWIGRKAEITIDPPSALA